MNSSMQTLSLNPFGNYDLALCIPGFEMSSFIPLKEENDDDYEDPEVANPLQSNYVSNMFESEFPQD